mmetsp:Transcript_46903/g.91565  ORF Transcript_46903/g.91565 Transcript_46903/m.91565 type:complete len:229 (-) Transcript_46903:177-863(-)
MVPSGTDVDARRSHSFTSGLASSLLAVTRCSPSTGFQTAAERAARPASRMRHHGFFCRRSHTTALPSPEALATMCETWEFQHTSVTGPVCPDPDSSLGANTEGSSGRSREVIRTPPSLPPVASRCALAAWGLKSSPPTGPEACSLDETTRGSPDVGSPRSMAEGHHTFTVPSDIPPATRPMLRDDDTAHPERDDHPREEKRAEVRDDARTAGEESDERHSEYSSSSPP